KEAVDAGTVSFDRGGDLAQPVGRRSAAVEADERIAGAEREARPVAQLLERVAGGEQPRRLAHLERALGRCPLVRAGADELEPARGRRDRRLRCRKGGGGGVGEGVEL